MRKYRQSKIIIPISFSEFYLSFYAKKRYAFYRPEIFGTLSTHHRKTKTQGQTFRRLLLSQRNVGSQLLHAYHVLRSILLLCTLDTGKRNTPPDEKKTVRPAK